MWEIVFTFAAAILLISENQSLRLYLTTTERPLTM